MRFLAAVLTLVVVAALGAGGLYLYQQHAQNKGIPLREVKIPGTHYHVKLPRGMGPEPVNTTIYLNREGAWLYAGADEAPRNRSSVVEHARLERVKIPAFTGSNARWQSIVRCIRSKLARYNVEIVDSRPVDRSYMMAVFGGRASLVGRKDSGKERCTGLAPFSGGSIHEAVVLIFSQALRNSLRDVCEVASHEIAHAYGLDHSLHCRDLMTYLKRCSKSRTFVDKDVRCGEQKARDCKGGEPRQNTHRELLRLLGPPPEKVAAKGKPSKAAGSR